MSSEVKAAGADCLEILGASASSNTKVLYHTQLNTDLLAAKPRKPELEVTLNPLEITIFLPRVLFVL